MTKRTRAPRIPGSTSPSTEPRRIDGAALAGIEREHGLIEAFDLDHCYPILSPATFTAEPEAWTCEAADAYLEGAARALAGMNVEHRRLLDDAEKGRKAFDREGREWSRAVAKFEAAISAAVDADEARDLEETKRGIERHQERARVKHFAVNKLVRNSPGKPRQDADPCWRRSRLVEAIARAVGMPANHAARTAEAVFRHPDRIS